MQLDDAIRSLNDYAHRGIPTGDFLRACLANDLFTAMARADATSRLIVYEICSHIHNFLPGRCYGSYELVDAWLKVKNKARAALAAAEAE